MELRDFYPEHPPWNTFKALQDASPGGSPQVVVGAATSFQHELLHPGGTAGGHQTWLEKPLKMEV